MASRIELPSVAEDRWKREDLGEKMSLFLAILILNLGQDVRNTG